MLYRFCNTLYQSTSYGRICPNGENLMRPIQIDFQDYRDRVHACWLGKNIGGTLGAPTEGRKELLSLTYYDPFPDKSTPNDDLDLQLVWLEMMREKGIYPTLTDFADYWKKHLAPYPWNEYGFCQRNLSRGLQPPISGCFENYYIDEMGSPIRSEIWACVAPGDPQLAAYLAWSDSALDHAGGEGTYGEMFWAAVESAAFVLSDPMQLIHIGLNMIPLHSLISRSIREAVWCYENGVEWEEARGKLIYNFANQQPCNAIVNHGFTILGWLYGKDFGDKLLKAVNCGYDTDCTGATLGSLLGILGGMKRIPDNWKDPIGDEIVLHRYTQIETGKTVQEITDRTVEIARKMLQERSIVADFADAQKLPDNLLTLLNKNDRALIALHRDPLSARVTVDGYTLVLHYNGEPVLHPGIEKIIGFNVEKEDLPLPFDISLTVPDGWRAVSASPLFGQTRFALNAGNVDNSNEIHVQVRVDGKDIQAAFTILGPGEARGFDTGKNVECCPKCWARIEACVCEQ
jgi:ADP-ribosylglycohydrolase